ncbi:MAG: PIN domain-containing protein [Verrucomicrobiaceae bacterium]|jgi:toxin-antitoxin system PIN domain toxin|nr:MAG: PIN domain-containing protein [Verrucomicrobiaceae bacterium]
MIVSADTNLFLYAANPDSPHHAAARRFFTTQASGQNRFLLCGLVLVEVYMQLRNPAVFRKPKTAKEAAEFCQALRLNPAWEQADYEPEVAGPLWKWAADTTSGFRNIIDARLALTLRHHGVTHFATANERHFEGFGFDRVWSPLSDA